MLNGYEKRINQIKKQSVEKERKIEQKNIQKKENNLNIFENSS